MAGEKCFVDYAGSAVPIVNADTGEHQNAQILGVVQGASGHTFAKAEFRVLL